MGEQVNTFEIAKRTQQLPAKIEDIVKFLFVGEPGLAWGKKMLTQMKSAGMVDKEHATLLEEARRLGDMVLDAYVRLGELLPDGKEAKKMGRARTRGDHTRISDQPSPLPDGIDKDKAHLARKLAKHPDAVAEIKKQARENDDIATKTAVVNKIKYEAALKKAGVKPETPQIILSAEEKVYLLTLEKIITSLPQAPPKEWSEEGLKRAKGYCNIIYERISKLLENKNLIKE